MNLQLRLGIVLVLLAPLFVGCGQTGKVQEAKPATPRTAQEQRASAPAPKTAPTTSVAFLRQKVAGNQLLLPAHVQVRQIEVDLAPREACITSLKDVHGYFTRSDLDEGELLLLSKLTKVEGALTLANQIRSGFLGVSVPVRADQAVGGYLREGMHIDLIITPAATKGAGLVDEALERVLRQRGGIILSNRRVLTVGRDAYLLKEAIETQQGEGGPKKQLQKGETYMERNPFVALPMKSVTLEVTPLEARVLTFLRDSKKAFTIVARNPLDDEEGMAAAELEDMLRTFENLTLRPKQKQASEADSNEGPPFKVTLVRGQQILKKSFDE